MKSKRRKRVIASVLCMVLMLSTGMSTLAEADAGTVPAVEEATAAQTTAQETKSTSTDAQTAETETQTQTETETQTETKQTEEAAQTQPEETTAAQPTEEASGGETTQTETDQTAQNTQDQTTSAETSGTETQNEAVETQPEETETTTPAEETQETKEEAGVSPAFNETYENSEVTVKVTADEGIVPEGAKLSVTPIVKKEITDQMSEEEKAETKKINDQYDLTEKKLSEDSDKNKEIMEGFLAYDISFLVDGKEVEPNGDVKVVIDFKKAAVPEGVSKDATVAVKHLKEDVTAEDGIVVEDMGEKADIQTTEKTEVEKVEFTAENFSVFTIGWTYTKGDDSTTGWEFKVEVVDIEGRNLQGDYKPDGEYYPQSSANVEDLARFLIGKEGIQKYKLEYVTINDWAKKPDPPITKMGLANDKTYYQVEGDDDRNTIREDDTVIFVFSERPELVKVNTEDTISKGIRIDVFDYQVGENGQEDTTKAAMKQSGINQDHTLKFISDRINDGYNSSGLKTGYSSIIQKLLKDEDGKVSEWGYPILTNNESLKYLFDENSIPNTKSAYLDVNNLFQKNEDGYYVFDSAQNYAYLDKSSGKFEVYNQPGSGFFPFTTTENMFEPKTVQESAKIGGAGMNHYLGMTVTSDFLQPENGQIQGSDGTLQNMRFDFTGDDDVWVYIDGVLVLDLGGIHSPVSGYIDFATGKVSAGGELTSIHDRFKDALGDDVADLFEQIPGTNNYRFKDFSDHTIKFFYLERGNDQSNCKITFNLQTIPKDSILVSKDVVTESGQTINYANDIDFQFQVKKTSGSSSIGEGVLKGAEYDLLENGVTIQEGLHTSETDGIFTLKHGQSALFKGFKENDTYIVSEVGASLDGYDVSLDETEITLKEYEGDDSTLSGWSTPELKVEELSNVIFRNMISKLSEFSVTKQMSSGSAAPTEAFTIAVKFQGQPYVGYYDLYDSNGLVKENEHTDDGKVELQAGQTARITGLPYGTSFEVNEELEDDLYFPSYSINGNVYDQILPNSDEDNNDINSVSGKVSGDCEVVVTNTKVAGEDLPYIEVQKTFEGITNPEQQVPNFQIDIFNSEKVKVKTLKFNDAQKSEDGLTYIWRLNNLAEGTYYIKESGEEIEGYEVTIRVNGSTVTQKGDYFEVITQKPTFQVKNLNDQIDSNSETDFNFDENNFIATILQDQTCFVWTEETLSLGEREAIVNLVKGTAHGNLSGKITVSNTRFYSTTDRIEDGIDLGFGEIRVQDGKLSFTHPKQWQHVIAGLYARTDEVNAEIELVNHYDPNYTLIDLQKYGTDYQKQYDGAVFELFCGEKTGDELKWNTSEPVENFGRIDVSSSNVSELKLMPGFYMLQEVKAPDGFRKLEEPIYFKIEAGKVELIDKDGEEIDNKQSMWELTTEGGIVLKIKNNIVYSLPSSGGPGIFWYTISGVLLLMAGTLILYNLKKGEVLKK